MKNSNSIFITLAIAFLGSSCVSMQKYKDMENARDHFKAETVNLKTVEQENVELKNELRVVKSQAQITLENLKKTTDELERTKKDLKLITDRYGETANENAKLLSIYSNEKQTYEEKLATNEDELVRRERQLKGLEETLGIQSSSVETMRMDLAAREQRVAELERLVAEKEAQMTALRLSLGDALRGFAESDLTVSERNGKIYVSLSQNLLFKSNSDKVDPKGVEALVKLASALQANPNIEIIVEGHTDNVGSVDYNWDLSTRRATNVVKILSINGVTPNRLTAAGRGMHRPLVPNDTEANKARNRRTEIILSPNLDKLMEMAK